MSVALVEKHVEVQFEQARGAYSGKIRTFARNTVNQVPGYQLDDLEQELLVVLWECVRSYDPNRGACFNTYFQRSAKNRMISLIRRYQTASRRATVMSLDVEAVAHAVDTVLCAEPAEDCALRRIDVREAVRTHGIEALDGRRSGRRRTA